MEGAHPSMPDTIEVVTEFWPKPKCGVCGKCMVPGNDHKNTRRVGRRKVVHLPLYKLEGLNQVYSYKQGENNEAAVYPFS